MLRYFISANWFRASRIRAQLGLESKKSVVSKVGRMTRRRVESDCNDYNRVA